MKSEHKHCLKCQSNLSDNKGYETKFCNRSCAVSYNNSRFPKRKSQIESNCLRCNSVMFLKKRKQGGFYNRKFCNLCLKQDQKNRIANRLGQDIVECDLENQTKISLYQRRKNWQSANSTIRKHARKVFEKSSLCKVCKICKYDKHIEICHIKQVKDFEDESRITDINSITNLVALCPNHHWEYDNGLINIVEE